jgi:acyl-coenzyme A synthetase/AMP-(fatty) acid ligase
VSSILANIFVRSIVTRLVTMLSDEIEAPSIVQDFDQLCFSIGDQDAIVVMDEDESSSSSSSSSLCYFEIQEYSNALASQLEWRFRPDYILVDGQGWPGAEAVATLACMRIHKPFVPVSCYDQHRPGTGRLQAVVDLLRTSTRKETSTPSSTNSYPSIVAVTVCANDRDPILSVFQQAGVHQILYLDQSGNLQEQFNVPAYTSTIPSSIQVPPISDDLYILFTSGTSSGSPKAVIGSHLSTRRRLEWFRNNNNEFGNSGFSTCHRIARRTKLTFVDGVTELWGALLDPTSMLVAVPPLKLQQQGVGAFLHLEISQILLLPSQLSQLLLLHIPIPTLKRVLVSGEPCESALLYQFQKQYPETQLYNVYGQTETTGDVCAACLTDLGDAAVVDHVVAVGKPMGTNKIRLTEDGELVIQGNLSNGYLGQPQAPSTEFATGDVGFCRNGIWYVQGRRHDVHKLNGIWTSPTEVSAAFGKVYNHTAAQVQVAATIFNGQPYVICTDSSTTAKFSREDMHKAGIPWNLIPQAAILCLTIPKTTTSGAGKVDRQAVRRIVQEYIDNKTSNKETNTVSASASGADHLPASPTLVSVVASVLDLTETQVDRSKSFVELGGDSARSITLLYILRQKELGAVDTLTATDILLAENLDEIQKILDGNERAKRRKVEDAEPRGDVQFVPQKPICSKGHTAVPLQACVDATPLTTDGATISAACQGGVIIAAAPSGLVVGHHQLAAGWMIQADFVLTEGHVIVCAYTLAGQGMVVSLDNNLDRVLWQREFEGAIKSSPILLGKDRLWFVAGDRVRVVNANMGKDCGVDTQLPHIQIAKPVVMKRQGWSVVVYASSDWDSGLMVVDEQGKVSEHLSDVIGPVYKDLVALDERTLLIADSYGCLHQVDIETMECATVNVSNKPLSAPTVLNNKQIVVGSYDGTLSCVMGTEILWHCDCGAVIYAKPLPLSDGSMIVCTTAGDVLQIGKYGNVCWRFHVPAEIWSDPVTLHGDGNTIAFGARDSKLHIVKLG